MLSLNMMKMRCWGFMWRKVSNPYLHVYLEIRNNTKGRVWVFYPSIFPIEFSAEKSELLWLSYWKFGSNDPAFDTGDEFSVSVFTDDPVVQIKIVGCTAMNLHHYYSDPEARSHGFVPAYPPCLFAP
uniref:Uncharacterized protein n=1 Tax=Populus trichocarpa TaxID=3694 RepID=A0A2K2C9D8_POPTR